MELERRRSCHQRRRDGLGHSHLTGVNMSANGEFTTARNIPDVAMVGDNVKE